jgi:hypothetical protein
LLKVQIVAQQLILLQSSSSITTPFVTTETGSSSAGETTTESPQTDTTTTLSNSDITTTKPTVPTLTSKTIATPDPAFTQTCNQQQCECGMRVDETVEGMGLFIEMEFELSGEFIPSFTVEIAAIRAFDLIIDWFPSDGDNFVLMEGTEASEGNDGDKRV